ncbi:histidine phosphatase family protein [Nocardia veterana]|uniref:Histidine phosphatase family protein n=1 Tax=Nocardia veterana TaxID=132249 RepID=A0A7X6LZ92_9NOCA|nr:histidine phosphatase family protein [Nocardia veterana]NKY87354.1 histidine phosphatase family protein [Nocardia veterana]
MSGSVTRLALISHAMTEAMRAARFPVDEPIERPAAAPPPPRADLALVGPEARTAQTAALWELPVTVEPALRDLDCGRWAGRSMDSLAPAELMAWLSDPGYREHGGESIIDLIHRVRMWLDDHLRDGRRILAITHPAVVRASVLVALAAPPESFWRIDIAPLGVTTLHGRGSTWTLRPSASM